MAHLPAGAAARANVPGRIVLVGNPNVGKSALFGALTGRYATVSNYPGTTVDVTSAEVVIDGTRHPVIDTPGTASFLPVSDEERVTRDLLLEAPVLAAVVVADAKELRRGIALALQLAEMGIPFTMCVNMIDEARALGLEPDLDELSEVLGVEVVATVATRGEGVLALRSALRRARPSTARVAYPAALETALSRVTPFLPESHVTARARALMALGSDDAVGLPPRARAELTVARWDAERHLPEPLACAITRARMDAATRITLDVAGAPEWRRRVSLRQRAEALTLHRFWGYPILLAVLAVLYTFVASFGAGTLVDLLEERLFGTYLVPWITAVVRTWVPWAWLGDMLVGPFGVVSMALTYALALILPIVTTFFIAFAVLEDSGYLPRLVVLANRAFRTIGLNGKAVLPLVLGLGCDTMATLTTRILETPKERIVAILLLALGVPCSAQLSVVLVLLGPLPAAAMVVWATVLVTSMLAVGWLASRLVPGQVSELVIELPPLRRPTLGNVLTKTLGRVEWYLKEAVPIFVVGTVLLFLADRAGLLAALCRAGEPVVVGMMGLPPEAATAFVAGFLRRDFGAAGLFVLAAEGRLDVVQALVAAVALTLFVPCFANFLMIARERGWKVALAVMAFIVPFAVLASSLLRVILEAAA